MNNIILSGRVCSIPKIKLLPIEGRSIGMCVFTIVVSDFSFCDEENENKKTDYFECVAFDAVAQQISVNFTKGSKIIVKGKMQNHFFTDVNQTKHFTQILVIEHAEFGDTESVFDKNNKKKPLDMVIAAEMKDVFKHYRSACENGFLCIDEEEYYKIAMSNI